MRYWYAKVYTPFCGEDADVYIKAENQEAAILRAREAANENGIEWFDEDDWLERHHDDENSIDDYYAQCGVQCLDAITEDEYKYREAEGEWCV